MHELLSSGIQAIFGIALVATVVLLPVLILMGVRLIWAILQDETK